MRKFLSASAIAALAAAGLVLGAGAAHADPTCNASPASASASGAQVCTPIGTATAHGDATTQSGYVIADGNSSNPGALGGYIGVDSNEGLVGCSNGDYTGSGDNPITPQSLAANSGPCAVSAP